MPMFVAKNKRLEVGQHLMLHYTQMKEDRSVWLANRAKLRARMDGQVPERQHIFDGQSNFTPPIGQTFVLLFLARAYKALLENDPSDYLVAQNSYGSILRDKVKPYLKGRFREADWRDYVREWMSNTASDGVSVVWPVWDEKTVPRLEVLDRFSDPRLADESPDLVAITQDMLLGEFEWAVKEAQVTGEWKVRITAAKGKLLRVGTVLYTDIIGATAQVEWDFDELKGAVALEVCDIESVVWSPHIKRPDKEGTVARKIKYSWARLQAMAEAKLIELPDLDEANAYLSLRKPAVEGAPPEGEAISLSGIDDDSGISQEREVATGITELYASTPTDKIEVLEFITPWDYRGDGSLADCIFWVLPQTSHCIKAVPLYREIRSGSRPCIFMWYGKKDGRAEGRGIPWLLEPLEDELFAFHNMTADSAIWAMSVFGFYKQSKSNSGSMEVSPWHFLPLDDPKEDANIITVNPNFQVGLQFTMFLMQLARDLIGVSEQSYGRPPKRAKGVYDTLALMQESNVRFDFIIEQWAESLSRLFTIWWELEQQYAPPDLTVTIPGVGGTDSFIKAPPRKDLSKCQYALTFEVNPSALNPALAKQSQQMILSIVTNPSMAQLGMVDRGNIYNAMEDFVLSLGRHDVSRYMSRPPEAISKRYSPDAEWVALLNGEEIRVHPMDDDEAHIADHVSRDAAVLSAPQEQRWLVHIQTHQRQQQGKQIAVQLATMQQQQQGADQQGKQVQNQGVTPPPVGGGATARDPMSQPNLLNSAAAAGGENASIGASGSLSAEQMIPPTNAGTGE